MRDELQRQPDPSGFLTGKVGAPARRKCIPCGEDARGLCSFPRPYSTCERPTCGSCGTVEVKQLRCSEHKGKEITAADLYDLSLDDDFNWRDSNALRRELQESE